MPKMLPRTEKDVYYHGGEDQAQFRNLHNQLAVLPDMTQAGTPLDLNKAEVGEPSENSQAEINRVRAILNKHESVFLSEGNAFPPPARAVACDLDVGNPKPIGQKARKYFHSYIPRCMNC